MRTLGISMLNNISPGHTKTQNYHLKHRNCYIKYHYIYVFTQKEILHSQLADMTLWNM